MQIVPGSEDDVPGQVTINPRGEEAKERAKWEQFDTEYTRRVGITGHFKPGNPPEKRANLVYPKMLYRTLPSPLHSNQHKCMVDPPRHWEFPNEDAYLRAKDAVEHFNLACTVTVGNEAEESLQKAQGFYNSVGEARQGRKDQQFEKFVQTGHREWDNRNMSDAAKAEVAAYDAAHPGHNPEIPAAATVNPENVVLTESVLRAKLAEIEAAKEKPKVDYAARVAKRKATMAAKAQPGA